MQRYEFNDGSSHKFWQIGPQGRELHVAWGRIGTQGQAQIKCFDSEAQALAALAKLVKEKTGKGYVRVDAGASGGVAHAAQQAAKDAAVPTPAAPASETDALRAAAPVQADAGCESAAGTRRADIASNVPDAPAAAPDGAFAEAAASSPPETDPALGGLGALDASPEAIEAALAERRSAPTAEARLLAILPTLLQDLVDDAFEWQGKTRQFTAARIRRRYGLDDLGWHLLCERLYRQHLAVESRAREPVLQAESAVRAASLLAATETTLAEQLKAGLAEHRQLQARVWAPLLAGEPAAAAPARFGQVRVGDHRRWYLRGQAQDLGLLSDAPLPAEQAWQRLSRSKLLKLADFQSPSVFAPRYARLHERLQEEPGREGQAPLPAPDAEADLALLEAMVHVLVRPLTLEPRLTVDYLVGQYGLPGTLDLLCRSLQSKACFDWATKSILSPLMQPWSAPQDSMRQINPYGEVWLALRRHLLEADDTLWQRCEQVLLDRLTQLPPERRGLLGPLMPESAALIDAIVSGLQAGHASDDNLWLLSCTDRPEAHRLLLKFDIGHGYAEVWARYAVDMLARVGPAVLPVLGKMMSPEALQDVALRCNHPEVIQWLAQGAGTSNRQAAQLRLATRAWPLAGAVAMARVSATGHKDASVAESLLKELLTELGPLARLVGPWLGPQALALFQRQLGKQRAPVRTADPQALPPVLRNPPWRAAAGQGHQAALPLALSAEALAALFVPPQERMELLRGSDEALDPANTDVNAQVARQLAADLFYLYGDDVDLEAWMAQAGRAIERRDVPALLQAWRDVVVARQPGRQGGRMYGYSMVLLPDDMGLPFWNEAAGLLPLHSPEVPVRYWGLRALPGLLKLLAQQSLDADALDALQPLGDAQLAVYAAKAATGKQRELQKKGLAWLRRWPLHAASGLLPHALGKTPHTAAAQAMLRRLLQADASGQPGPVARKLQAWAAQLSQADMAAAAQAFFHEDPLLRHPAKVPALPAFWQPAQWARPVLQQGGALDEDALTRLGQMLMFPREGGVYAGIAQVQAACTPESMADFAWDLFTAWLSMGAVAKDNWAFTSLGLLGGDAAARRLTPLIRTWPGESAAARALLGLDVLEAMGTDTALMMLNGIAQKLKFANVKAHAQAKVAAIAAERGLSPQELDDRLVPELGLDARGTLVLDFGPRQFLIGFDESLKPWVRDFSAGQPGARLKDLPKPGKSDDAGKAAAAVDQFKALKKDARTIAQQQLPRWENAMCQQRRWEPEVFQRFMAAHPLMGHVAQRLVWGVYAVPVQEDDEGELRVPLHGGTLQSCFRVAEDGSYSDAGDDRWALPAAAPQGQALRIGLVHPLQLSVDDHRAFAQQLADYELLQPFEQINRRTFTLTEAEAQAEGLTRWQGQSVPTTQVLGLMNRGWEEGDGGGGGVIDRLNRRLGDGRVLELTLEPGLLKGDLTMEPEQTLGPVSWHFDGRSQPWGALDVLNVSELMREMAALSGH